MTIKEIRKLTGLSQPNFCDKYRIPLTTLRKWEQGQRTPPDYLVELLEFKVMEDLGMKFTLRNFLNALSNDIECTIVNDRYLEMAKTILNEEYIGLDDDVEKFEIKDNKLFIWT